ncbi:MULTISPECIES: cupin domain-containing protein [Paraclostridium]|uniref:Ethanolamine utilization protein EutQ n=1 Tax=Paraclostridium benzoelyticum TaxID=1629550 RepID=A0A0M3DFU0_9FIRM|nr:MULTISPECIES: cupin domain-containing protein [Paraclostridium]KKY00344.1 ethanolamine utilization protein EutQ [Paraclostridium benzoelyticum]MCU9814459.1 cupin domain-containing protein [Paraclostridium sp. AKS73]MDM8126964.1 cupin domain-containing protein [Paraclostridium benzoelyticum]OXX84644.1 ethanolamine utilization protein EutQ [Paraclostridium benzoelyticum]
MDIKNLDKSMLEQLVRQIIQEKINGSENSVDFLRDKDESGVISIKLPTVKVDESNRLDTGNPSDVVYTKDLFTLEESPRLGCGIMEMKETTFDWTLDYDEVDYVIEGTLDIIINGKTVSASAGELILIPKGSSIQFSVKDYARFIYVTYPADWASQN